VRNQLIPRYVRAFIKAILLLDDVAASCAIEFHSFAFLVEPNKTADLSTPLRFGRDDKFVRTKRIVISTGA
jgi:hypothetical protein